MTTLMTISMTTSFTGTVAAQWTPLVLTGQAGCGKTTLVLLLASALGARIAFKTTTKPQDKFNQAVDWDAIDALVIDEIDGWESASLRDALPSLLVDARAREKGVIIVGQTASSIADLLPPDCVIAAEWRCRT